MSRLVRTDRQRMCPHRMVLAAVALAAFHAPVPAQVFFGTDPSGGGSTVLSNFQTQEAPTLLLPAAAETASPQPLTPPDAARPVTPASAKAERWRDVVEGVATAVGVSPRLIHAVISAESNYDPQAVSPKGAIGLMQLMPSTARRFRIKDPSVARDNVYAGASYLKWLIGYFHGDVELVLAAYNAGEQAVVRAGHKVPRYPETQTYVKRVMADLQASGSWPL